MTGSIASEIQKLSPSALVDLYVVDLSKYGGGLFRFHAGTNELGGDVVWQGQTYIRLPIEVKGFEARTTGALPRPTISISNISGIMAAAARDYGGFLGCKLVRKRTFARFLDAVNFTSGNASADPTQALADEVWFFDRKVSENAMVLTYELSSALDLAGVRLPRRQIIQNCCAWTYRSAECGYAGGAVAKDDDTPTTDLAQDRCSKSLTGCKKRFSGTLPFGGFPGCGLVR